MFTCKFHRALAAARNTDCAKDAAYWIAEAYAILTDVEEMTDTNLQNHRDSIETVCDMLNLPTPEEL